MTFKHIARRIDTSIEFLYFDIQSYGLCNQLFSLACAVADGSIARKPVAFRGIYPDITSINFIPIQTFIDVDETNKNLAPLGTKILTMVKNAQRLVRPNMFAVNDVQAKLQKDCLKALVFSSDIRKNAQDCTPKEPFYCIHFRLDVDMLLFYRAGVNIYHTWIGLTGLKRESDARNIVINQIEKNREWLNDRIQAYASAVLEQCQNINAPIYVLTAIGKPTVHLGQNDSMEWAFLDFEKKVAPHRLIRCAQKENHIGREYAAAVELCVACSPQLIGFVASGGSTFSETIRIRNEPEKLLTVVN